MPTKKPAPPAPYPPEFRRRLIELVRGGQSPEALARKFEPSAQTIRNWVRQADLDEGQRSDGLTTKEREELVRLRRENRTLREEREILKKAAAWFAKESDSSPPKRSVS
jgi:transposase